MKHRNGAPAATPLAIAQAKWEASGLTAAHAKRLRLRTIDAAEAARLVPIDAKVQAGRAALVLPYFDWHGKPTSFFRLRYLGTPVGFAAALAKPVRYVQPPNTLNEVYLPPIGNVNWIEARDSTAVSLVVTEGELKAAAACAFAIPALGLGGVSMWRAGKRGLDLLPQLAEIKWPERKVYIVFDSDAATNVDVLRAQLALARELTRRGAFPLLVELPALGGEKTGLDDYLMSSKGGPKRFAALLDAAPEFGRASALWELNAEVMYAREPNAIVVRETGQVLDRSGFEGLAYADRSHYELDEKGKSKSVSTATAWVKWPARATVPAIIYEPGQPKITPAGYNTWRGWGCEPKRGDVTLWRKLLDYLFASDPPEVRQWFERWCAYPLQHPGAKMYTCAMIWGTTQGTGKTLVGETLMRIYGENGELIDADHLSGAFNSWAEHRQFILGEEITGTDRRRDSDRLKGMISRERVRINAKYRPEYTIRDCVNYYFTSNHPDALFLEDTDRRGFIHEAPKKPLPLSFYRAQYDPWLRTTGPAAVFDHLLRLDLGSFDPNAPALDTRAKREMIRDVKSDVGLWVAQLLEDPDGTLHGLPERIRSSALFTTSELLRAYDPIGAGRVTLNGIGRELKRAGVTVANRGATISTTAAGPQRLLIIRDHERWEHANPKRCAEHFDTLRIGVAKAKVPKFKPGGAK